MRKQIQFHPYGGIFRLSIALPTDTHTNARLDRTYAQLVGGKLRLVAAPVTKRPNYILH